MLRRITVAVSQNLNCYMIHVKKDKCCSKLAAATWYMLRRITVAESRNCNCYMIHVKKDKCCSKLAAATWYMLRKVTVAESQNLNCYMIHSFLLLFYAGHPNNGVQILTSHLWLFNYLCQQRFSIFFLFLDFYSCSTLGIQIMVDRSSPEMCDFSIAYHNIESL